MYICGNKTRIMETEKQRLEQELKDLQIALQKKSVSVNEYCSFYHQTAKKIKEQNKIKWE